MKILITGSMGFISRNLIEKSLLNDPRISKIYGIDHITLNPLKKYYHYKFDLTKNILNSLPNELFEVDLIIHNAGIPLQNFIKLNHLKL